MADPINGSRDHPSWPPGEPLDDVEILKRIVDAAHRVVDAVDSGADPTSALDALRTALGRQ